MRRAAPRRGPGGGGGGAPPGGPPAKQERKDKQDTERGKRTVDRFRTSSRGLRGVFTKHFPEHNATVESLVFHLAQVEAQLPCTVEAIRLARYPGAGNRNAKRMALGLWENLSVLEAHLKASLDSLECLAKGAPDSLEPEGEADEELHATKDGRGI